MCQMQAQQKNSSNAKGFLWRTKWQRRIMSERLNWNKIKCLTKYSVKCNSDTLIFNQTIIFGDCVTVKERYNRPSFTLLKSVFETVFTWRHRRPSNVVTLLQSKAISCDKTALTKINKMKCLTKYSVKCNSDTLLFNQTFIFGDCVTDK